MTEQLNGTELNIRVLFSVGTLVDIIKIYFRNSGDILVWGNPLSKHSLGGQWLQLFSKNKTHHDLAPFSSLYLFSHISCLSQMK